MGLPASRSPNLMRRLIVVALTVSAAVLVLAALVWWLPGPRADLPGANGTSSQGAGPTASRSPAGLPDPRRTPGSINPNVTQANIDVTICKSGWTATVRPPSGYTGALKLVQIEQYGYADRNPSHYQEDHLVPLELGGAPRDPANLWPEPNRIALEDGTSVGSDAKDGLEDYLRKEVCGGSMRLDDAQRLIAGDWVAAWESAGRP
jgi:hypothetical protein